MLRPNNEIVTNLYLLAGVIVSLANAFIVFCMVQVSHGRVTRSHGGEDLELLALVMVGVPAFITQCVVLLPLSLHIANRTQEYDISIVFKRIGIAAPIISIASLMIGLFYSQWPR